jgi:hypothetical protein
MTALPPKADIARRNRHVRFVAKSGKKAPNRFSPLRFRPSSGTVARAGVGNTRQSWLLFLTRVIERREYRINLVALRRVWIDVVQITYQSKVFGTKFFLQFGDLPG